MHETTIKCIIDSLSKANVNLEIFTNGDTEDTGYTRSLYSKLCPKVKLTIPTIPKELTRTVSSNKGIITSRLHSCIIAYSLDHL